jgi:hypothetical protein
MSRVLFFCLLLANGALFAYLHGNFDKVFPNGREPARLANQLNADKVKLITAGAAAKAANSAGPQPSEPDWPSAVKKNEIVACTEIGNFDAADAARFETRLVSLALGDRLSRRTVQEASRHMVYIPPLGGKDAADKKAAELRKLGVTDFYVILDAVPLRWGISLGIFKTEDAARAHLATMSQKGVRTARLGLEPAASNKVAYKLRQLDAVTKSGLDLIKADFPAQEVRVCEGE